MAITKETIQQVAHLARIELKADELEIISGQIRDVVDFIDQLKKADISDIKPTSHVLPVNNVLRNDNPGESLPVDTVLMNAPDREGNFFGVPKVIE